MFLEYCFRGPGGNTIGNQEGIGIFDVVDFIKRKAVDSRQQFFLQAFLVTGDGSGIGGYISVGAVGRGGLANENPVILGGDSDSARDLL